MPKLQEVVICPKFIASISMRGFEMTPIEVQTLIGTPASLLVKRGEARVPGGTPFGRSVASWKLEFPDSTRIEEMIPALLSLVGGAAHLAAVKAQVLPEFLEVDISMWVLDSEEQEGGAIDVSTIASLAQLGASLSFGLYPRHIT